VALHSSRTQANPHDSSSAVANARGEGMTMKRARSFPIPLHNFYSCPCIVGHPCTCKVVPQVTPGKLDRLEKIYDSRPWLKEPFVAWARRYILRERRQGKAK
jgi:hypothetical protein